jgi:ribosomal protein S18 acetylase RimI-like enzyme
MKIRAFTRSDVRGMLAVARKLHPKWVHESRLKSLPVDLRYQHGCVAVGGGKIVGFISCSCEDGIPRVTRLGVDPALHRQGIGKALVAAAECDAQGAGADVLQVMAMGWTRPFCRHYADTRAFYKALGFKVVKKHPIHKEGADRWRIPLRRRGYADA